MSWCQVEISRKYPMLLWLSYTPMPMASMSLPMSPPMFPSYASSYESSCPSFAPRVPSYVPFNSFVPPVAPIPSYACMPSDFSLLCHYPLTYHLLCFLKPFIFSYTLMPLCSPMPPYALYTIFYIPFAPPMSPLLPSMLHYLHLSPCPFLYPLYFLLGSFLSVTFIPTYATFYAPVLAPMSPAPSYSPMLPPMPSPMPLCFFLCPYKPQCSYSD